MAVFPYDQLVERRAQQIFERENGRGKWDLPEVRSKISIKRDETAAEPQSKDMCRKQARNELLAEGIIPASTAERAASAPSSGSRARAGDPLKVGSRSSALGLNRFGIKS
ncbi:hypothetical protein SAMN05216548_101356 [Faunimonas pinastri]|uniref:Uncharacterized protein n=1 Tax=Faunimonas pinastri TaxID=1855383 RepID=A0A1H9AAB9_9HYPH|nr:hypothetical protein [Faunimonas pinastri]SEP72928.1 hypothetical protein SAMN05216548_101356 [Faunimonas pinastri]